jgi:hypothetical protein
MDDPQRTPATEAYRAQLHEWGLRTAPEVETTLARKSLGWCVISPLAGIPVAAAHDVAVWLAVVVGVLVAAGYVALARGWNSSWPWRWYAVAALTVVTFYPALAWWPWAVLAAVLAVIPASVGLAAAMTWRHERHRAAAA